MDNVILIIIGLLSGYYLYRRIFKCSNGKPMCKSCGMYNFCQVSGSDKKNEK